MRLRHQEDLAQAMGLDWRATDVKSQEPDWPTDPRRATARRIGELLGSIPGGDAAVEQWLRQLTFHVAIGDNDAHAKNVALMHLSSGTELSQVYDALPNLFQDGLIKWDLALAVDGVFDHRRMSVERILAESISVVTDRRCPRRSCCRKHSQDAGRSARRRRAAQGQRRQDWPSTCSGLCSACSQDLRSAKRNAADGPVPGLTVAGSRNPTCPGQPAALVREPE